jgi:Acetyltransferase (GNAT) domain
MGARAMQCTIAQASDRTLWAAGMSASGANDVYYRLEYHQLYSFHGGRCLAYIARVGGETLFHPFFLRPIGRVGSVRVSGRLNDIETVYGYAGPIATTDSREFLAEAWRGFEPWCRENSVVTEFIRFNPLLRTQRFAHAQTEVSFDRETVIVSLEGDEETLWHSYPSVQRNSVRKARKAGLRCVEANLEDGLTAFVHLYEATMRRVDAAAFYHFPLTYYDRIERTLAANTKLFFVKFDGKTVAGGLFFLAGDTVHYHLSGSCADTQQLAPNNLLLHEVAVWGQRHGFRSLHLGGGRSHAPDDPLLGFKKRVSRQVIPFYLGRHVHDQEQYNDLCELWKRQYGESMLPSYFPPYRARSHARLCHDTAA